GSVPVAAALVNAGPVPLLQSMFSTCQSAHSALIFARALFVPPVALPPGTLVAWPLPIPLTVTFEMAARFAWLVVSAIPAKVTLVPDAWAGANTINVVGFE